MRYIIHKEPKNGTKVEPEMRVVVEVPVPVLVERPRKNLEINRNNIDLVINPTKQEVTPQE